MAFVEDNPRCPPAFFAAPCSVDHHQRMIGNHDIRGPAGPANPFDEAFFVMRASRVNTLAAPISQRGGAIAAKQCGQPAGQISANHVPITAIRRPARGQMRKHRSTSRKAALQRILKFNRHR